MKKLDEFKTQYEDIKASPELINKVNKILAEDRSKSEEINMKKNKTTFAYFGKYASIAAGILVLFTVSVNVSPKMAYAMSDIPVLNSIVKVLTLGKYEINENGYELNVVTPQIEGLLDKELEDKLNLEFKNNADAIIAAFEKDVKSLKEEFGDQEVHMGIESSYIVKTDNDDILAIDAYILNTAGSSSTKHSFYTIDKKTGQLLTLKGLFKDDADYVNVISDYIKSEMKRLNQEEEGLFFDDPTFGDVFDKIKDDQNFYINNNGNLVICFDKYDIAAGAQGSPEFVIPDDLIADIVK